MTNTQVKTIYLKDYQAPHYWVTTLDLVFDLYEDKTIVTAKMQCQRNDAIATTDESFKLNGEGLKLLSITLDGETLTAQDYHLDEEGLSIHQVPQQFTVEITNEIHPEKNTELSGLYRSNAMFCTQCEAEGFRRITYYPDRPDVMAKFTTTIRADKKCFPVLLSNGNCIARGDLDAGRHWVTWEDPYKKPCYLFALVAGDLVAVEDHFVTVSGRLVALKIFVERENQDKCQYAMEALKKAMIWDEKTYSLEYDLDIYMIVAVNDFNMGAMENKGLNIFNAKYILARPDTATDADFQGVDTVVGHEYFHNWTGNRVTCRDWFQLSLKEGLTVFREEQFSKDISGSAVSLIEKAALLRAHQFIEDSGPLAHPVQPESYQQIDNFYTSTIYEKGAEVIRMIKTLLGWDTFRQGMDLYIQRHDGQAVTIENFVNAFETVSKQDLSQFKLWYSQAGTPSIIVTEDYNEKEKIYHLTLKQSCPPTPGQPIKNPMHIPVAVGLLDAKGKDLLPGNTQVISLKEETQTFAFKNIAEKPTLSILREFSAPVKIVSPLSNEKLAFLLANDSDPFNRWDAGQKLSERMILALIKAKQAGQKLIVDPHWMESMHAVLMHPELEAALKVEILGLPPTSYLIELIEKADTDVIFEVKKLILKTISKAWEKDWQHYYRANLTPGLYQYTTENADKRSLKNLCLQLLLETEKKEAIALCMEQWKHANNMTDTLGALSAIADVDCSERVEMLNEFYERWQHNPLVVSKWFRIQAFSSLPETFEVVKKLTQHSAFDLKNPNKVYSLINAFALGNLVRFHDKSGAPYFWLADTIMELDSINPQVASRAVQALVPWRRFEPHRQTKMKEALMRIQSKPKLSRDLGELVQKSLQD